MRKVNQAIHEPDELAEIIQSSNLVYVAFPDKEVPYLLPFNYGFDNGILYIHSAGEGKKQKFTEQAGKVGFLIVQGGETLKDPQACKWSTRYRSVCGEGYIEREDEAEKKEAALRIIMKHHGADGNPVFEQKQVDSIVIWKIIPEKLTGKKSSNWDRIIAGNRLEMETERLNLQEIDWNDLDDIHRLHSIPEVDQYNTLGIPADKEATRNVMRPLIDAQQACERKGYTWKIRHRETGDFLGLAGISLSLDRFRLGEIYYKLLPEHWGKGYATEVARELVRTGFETFNLQKVEAGVATENLRSVRVLEKIGMTQEGLRRKILPIRGEWKDNYHYAIVRDDPRDY